MIAAQKQESRDEPPRFFDNRQKHLFFVRTCNEKCVIGDRVSLELENVGPRRPAVRLLQ